MTHKKYLRVRHRWLFNTAYWCWYTMSVSFDLSSEFRRLRADHKAELGARDDGMDDTESLLLADENSISEQPEWLQLANSVKADLTEVERNMTAVQQGRADRQRNILDDQLDVRLDVLTQKITRLFREATGKVSRMSRIPARGEAAVVKGSVVKTLSSQISNLSTAFRQDQAVFLRDLRQRSGVVRADSSLQDEETQYRESRLAQVLSAEHTRVEDVQQDVMNVVRSISDLGQMAKDMSMLVVDQGTLLDRIDYNMTVALDDVEAGVTDLTKSEEYQKRAKCLQNWTYILAGLTGLIIVIMVISKG
ncbi:syntaxin-16 [Kipferlia bialata]|uniref:Syntaxin-16 n=1 Tax=Kipferlia bialata TaxID=797122 RepID=A0A9K3CZI4_9EUKA|nr:syntaxin-16 [Kipferlia bialata]|eukprot:g6056.t1